MRTFPTLVITWPASVGDEAVEMMLAEIDACAPTAVEPLDRGVRLFFASPAHRARAAATVAALDATLDLTSMDVPDDDWAERSQAAVRAIRVGALTIAPPWDMSPHAGRDVIVIQPSMGFGTGHHASTRLCLQLLRELGVAGARVLDVGTGSGVLGIAASRLGAAQVLAIDCDGDALTSARENVALNGEGASIRLQHVELASLPPELSAASFDIVLANLTAAVLIRHAETLARRLAPAGVLIASGFGQDELTEVAGAFAVTSLAVTTRADEGEWVALTFGAASAAQATSR